MQYTIADLMDAVKDDSVDLEPVDLASAERIKELTMKKIQEQARPHIHTLRRTLLIAAAAALILALGVTAYATGLFRQNLKRMSADETLRVHLVTVNPDGAAEEYNIDARGIGMVIDYEGASAAKEVEFKPGWLPEVAGGTYVGGRGDHAGEGWYRSYEALEDMNLPRTDDSGLGIPYQIEIHYASPGFRYVVFGECEVIRETKVGTLELTSFVQRQHYSSGRTSVTNFALLFSPDEGWMISVGGDESVETLEKIARGLQVRGTGNAVTPPDLSQTDFCALCVGRG